VNMDWQNLNFLLMFVFISLAGVLVWGLFLQASAIVKQSKSFSGILIKMMSLFGLLGLVYFVKQNPIPYLIVFSASLVLFLGLASLASRSLLR
jgi:hypothetical protein